MRYRSDYNPQSSLDVSGSANLPLTFDGEDDLCFDVTSETGTVSMTWLTRPEVERLHRDLGVLLGQSLTTPVVGGVDSPVRRGLLEVQDRLEQQFGSMENILASYRERGFLGEGDTVYDLQDVHGRFIAAPVLVTLAQVRCALAACP